MRRSAFFALVPFALATASCGGSADNAEAPEATSEAPAASETAEVTETASATPARPAAFVQCAACHQVEPGKHGVGPSLAGVFGAKAGHAQGYNYSPAMLGSGLTWDEATLDKYLTAPMQTVKGTKMAFAGIKDEAKRKEVIAYLKTLK